MHMFSCNWRDTYRFLLQLFNIVKIPTIFGKEKNQRKTANQSQVQKKYTYIHALRERG